MSDSDQSLPKFEFYEALEVRPDKDAGGERGAVLGRSIGEKNGWTYAIQLDGSETTQMFDESNLKTTGQYRTREDYYDGATLRVVVDDSGGGHATRE